MITMPRNGSAISLPPATSHQEMSMNEASLMCEPATSEATRNVISSEALADGRLPCVSPDGPTTDLFGQEVVRASPSRPPARARRPMTNATCGLRGFLSSASAALEQSLVSKLRRRLDGAGSTLFSLTWSRKATPAHRPYYQLAALARPISGSDCGSWPTPRALEGQGSPIATLETALREIKLRGTSSMLHATVHLASWPTPDASVGNLTDTTWQERRAAAQEKHGNNGFGMTIAQAAQLSAWPTPSARDWKSSASNQHGINARPLNEVARLASWATPRVSAGRTGTNAMDRQDSMSALSLEQQAETATGIVPREVERLRPEMQARLGFGATATGSPAPTEKRGQLNPAFSLWLMGYPPEWGSCAPQAMRSCRNSRHNSSKHT
jgi:hypothetical protein